MQHIVNTLLSAHEPAGYQPTPLELLMRMCRRRREVIAIVAKMAAPAAGWPIAEAHALAQVDPLSIGEERAEMLVRHVSAR
jgi:hypothetical protein